MPKFKAKKEKKQDWSVYLVPAVFILLLLIIFVWLVKPRLEEISLYRREIKTEEEELSQLTAKTAALEDLDLTELSQKSDLVVKALPAEEKYPLLLTVLKVLAEENGARFKSIEINPDASTAGSKKEATASAENALSEMDFILTLIGQDEQIKNMLFQIHRVFPLMEVESAELKSLGGENEYEVAVKANSPFLILPESLGKAGEPLKTITAAEEVIYQKLTQFEYDLVVEEDFFPVPAGKTNPFSF